MQPRAARNIGSPPKCRNGLRVGDEEQETVNELLMKCDLKNEICLGTKGGLKSIDAWLDGAKRLCKTTRGKEVASVWLARSPEWLASNLS